MSNKSDSVSETVAPLQIRESRPKVTLVARMVASVANYDYIMDWEFQMDGLVRIKVRTACLVVLVLVTHHHHPFHVHCAMK
jgi:primary-amine oxidase